jgi:hypothetical protein
MSILAGSFGQAVPPAPARYDIAPEPAGDNVVGIIDVAKMASFFGMGCTP